ncbi:hypothetical protein B0H11DRAFT_2027390 [Mycena galericulata]|nr:hypothetical protein B0H11DRAFT_2096502 [Mycena galericulata]KAJ7479424.1 hypothetical protein B0H11DRAFT_2027390 [Mycena galericulata]
MLTALSFLPLFAAVVSAAPRASSPARSIPRGTSFDGLLFVGTNTNWNTTYYDGSNADFEFNVSYCYNFPAPFNDTISSYTPDNPKSIICTLHVNPDCSGNSSESALSPGIANETKYNDQFSSFTCRHSVAKMAVATNITTEKAVVSSRRRLPVPPL